MTAVVCMRFMLLFDVCKCDVFICSDACGLFLVVECYLFILSGRCMLCKSGCVRYCDSCLFCDG